eukprot:1159762-Pelagomonas_calceolata.AAC.5
MRHVGKKLSSTKFRCLNKKSSGLGLQCFQYPSRSFNALSSLLHIYCSRSRRVINYNSNSQDWEPGRVHLCVGTSGLRAVPQTCACGQQLHLVCGLQLCSAGLELQPFSYNLALFLIAGPAFFLRLPWRTIGCCVGLCGIYGLAAMCWHGCSTQRMPGSGPAFIGPSLHQGQVPLAKGQDNRNRAKPQRKVDQKFK